MLSEVLVKRITAPGLLDVWRAIGDTEKADALERSLLDARCLPLGRIEEALERIAATDKSAAEAARKKVAEYTTVGQ